MNDESEEALRCEQRTMSIYLGTIGSMIEHLSKLPKNAKIEISEGKAVKFVHCLAVNVVKIEIE